MIVLPMLAALALPAERAVVVSPLTTEQLVRHCAGKDDATDPDFCTGYILAAFDILSLSRQICPSPTLSTTAGAIATTRKYLRTRGKKSNAAPAFLVRESLRRTYPCKRP